jgi:hypothetical protein
MTTAFHDKAEILYDLNNYGTDTVKYGDFIEANRLRFNTAWLAFSLSEYTEAELPDDVSATVNDLWNDVLNFVGVSDSGFETIEDLDPTLDTTEEEY